MIPEVIFQVMLELGHKGTLGAAESLVLLDVLLGVFPEVLLVHGHEGALLASMLTRFAMTAPRTAGALLPTGPASPHRLVILIRVIRHHARVIG